MLFVHEDGVREVERITKQSVLDGHAVPELCDGERCIPYLTTKELFESSQGPLERLLLHIVYRQDYVDWSCGIIDKGSAQNDGRYLTRFSER